MVRTIIQLPDNQAEALERTAKQRGVSKAAVVRQALADLFERQRRDALVDRALAAAGTGASGLPDLAERHDEHLAADVSR